MVWGKYYESRLARLHQRNATPRTRPFAICLDRKNQSGGEADYSPAAQRGAICRWAISNPTSCCGLAAIPAPEANRQAVCCCVFDLHRRDPGGDGGMTWVTRKKAQEELGLSHSAIRHKISTGQWRQGAEWVKVDGRLWIDLEGVENWICQKASELNTDGLSTDSSLKEKPLRTPRASLQMRLT